MKKFLKIVRNIIYSILIYPIIIFCKLIYGKKCIFCECYMHNTILLFKKRNWGDDLNKFFFEYISDIKILTFPFSKMIQTRKLDKYSLIGSILSFYNEESKTIYGTGAMSQEWKINGYPKKILSVRGPKTRQVLLENKINCPECYGDPVLLLPLFYKCNVSKTKRGGLILNMGTDYKKNEMISEIESNYNLKTISMTKYNKWTDVIDEICSCDFIISESLHGLIVAETYGIPNVWVEFMEHPNYWNFKFDDFYASIEKSEKIIKIDNSNDIEEVIKKIKDWKKGNIDYKKLLSFYPFEIKKCYNIEK